MGDDLKTLQAVNKSDNNEIVDEENTLVNKAKAKTDKFIWSLLGILLIDVICCPFCQTWSAPLLLLIIEIILINALAEKFKIKGTLKFINKVIKITLDKVISSSNPK
jgi:hypothetical protein